MRESHIVGLGYEKETGGRAEGNRAEDVEVLFVMWMD